jgi:hypothetical protein
LGEQLVQESKTNVAQPGTPFMCLVAKASLRFERKLVLVAHPPASSYLCRTSNKNGADAATVSCDIIIIGAIHPVASNAFCLSARLGSP